MNSERTFLYQGNEACAEGALYAKARFFGGYPITPSTEIAEIMARKLPLLGGKYIQMEDEIASLASVIGASLVGVKAFTATSGPGFSLMQEHIGYAFITEVPCVIINVMRGGPSTGLPTKVSQSDVMQARWGTHGDYVAIVLAPASVKECFEQTVRAFNLAEHFRTPVILLNDEILGHMREKITIPGPDELPVENRHRPTMPAQWYQHYENTASGVSPMASFGEGYRFHVTGLTHDVNGFPTSKTNEILQMVEKITGKILKHPEAYEMYEDIETEDAEVLLVAYGITSRAAEQAVHIARKDKKKVGLFRPITLWPFPEKALIERLKNVQTVIVPELNIGMMVNEVERVVAGRAKVHSLPRYDAELISPSMISKFIQEVHHGHRR